MDEVKTQVDEVKTQVHKVKVSIRLIEVNQEFLKKQIDNVRNGVNNGMAIQLNSLQKWLDDPIQPVSAYILIKDEVRFTIAIGFPITI